MEPIRINVPIIIELDITVQQQQHENKPILQNILRVTTRQNMEQLDAYSEIEKLKAQQLKVLKKRIHNKKYKARGYVKGQHVKVHEAVAKAEKENISFSKAYMKLNGYNASGIDNRLAKQIMQQHDNNPRGIRAVIKYLHECKKCKKAHWSDKACEV